MDNILVIIPDYGEKTSVTRKNLRILVDKPLICYAVSNISKSRHNIDMVVSTNDVEIERICKKLKVDCVNRASKFDEASVTIDPIVYDAVKKYENKKNKRYEIIVTVQPTSPLLSAVTFDEAIDSFISSNYDTYISAVNKPRLAWEEEDGKFVPLYEKRVNRKFLPKHLVETGTFVISKRENIRKKSRFGEKIYIYEMDKNEGLEILSVNDWIIAENELKKKKILIRLEGTKQIGMGHIYRGIQLANMLFEHTVYFAISEKSDIAIEKIKQTGYKYFIIENNDEVKKIVRNEKIDIVVNDILNTDKKYVQGLKKTGCRVVNLEDLGEGIRYADVVINDLYVKQNDLPNCYWGQKYYCIKDEFLTEQPKPYSEKVNEVLVLFGGTDPANITEKAILAIDKLSEDFSEIHYTFIVGAGNKNYKKIINMVNDKKLNASVLKDVEVISEYMAKADLAFSSQGRTMFELAYMNIPTVIIAQSERELSHEFGYVSNGFINLGLAKDIDENTIFETLSWIIKTPNIRKQMVKQMMNLDIQKGIHRVKKLILGD